MWVARNVLGEHKLETSQVAKIKVICGYTSYEYYLRPRYMNRDLFLLIRRQEIYSPYRFVPR